MSRSLFWNVRCKVIFWSAMMAANERNKCPRHTQIPAESESSGKVPFYRYTLFTDTTRTGAAEGHFDRANVWPSDDLSAARLSALVQMFCDWAPKSSGGWSQA